MYFIKVIHKQTQPNRRDIYIMALNVDYIAKWEYCLSLEKEPDFVDPFFSDLKSNLLNRIFQTTKSKTEARGQLETIQEDPWNLDRTVSKFSDQGLRISIHGGHESLGQSGKSNGFDQQNESKLQELKEQRKQALAAQKIEKRNIGEAFEYMMNGATFIKYGKKGAPKARHIFLHDKFICWRDPKDMRLPDLKSKRKIKRMIELSKIT